MTRSVLTALTASTLALAACADVPLSGLEGRDDAAGVRVEEGSAAAFGILALLNDGKTDLALLDDAVALDSRAASALIWHRNGPDGVLGTSDDDLYDSVAEADAQYYVGTSALAKLESYADLHGYTPGDDDHVGTWDGVDFTWGELVATLDLADTATELELDDDFRLDRRAVDSILANRPFATLDDLADSYFVGTFALEQLKYHADLRAGAGEWESCNVSADCADGLVCLGELLWPGAGMFCVDEEEATGTYGGDLGWSIPDGDPVGVSDAVVVDDLLTVPIDVMVTLDIDHDRPSDLLVLLEDGNGMVGVVWDHEDAPADQVVVRAFPSDDMVNGTWTLTVIDDVAGVQGTIASWELYITSTWD